MTTGTPVTTNIAWKQLATAAGNDVRTNNTANVGAYIRLGKAVREAEDFQQVGLEEAIALVGKEAKLSRSAVRQGVQLAKHEALVAKAQSVAAALRIVRKEHPPAKQAPKAMSEAQAKRTALSLEKQMQLALPALKSDVDTLTALKSTLKALLIETEERLTDAKAISQATAEAVDAMMDVAASAPKKRGRPKKVAEPEATVAVKAGVPKASAPLRSDQVTKAERAAHKASLKSKALGLGGDVDAARAAEEQSVWDNG